MTSGTRGSATHPSCFSPSRGLDRGDQRGQPPLMQAISGEIVALYARVHGHDRTTATTYINDNVVLGVLANILTDHEVRFMRSWPI